MVKIVTKSSYNYTKSSLEEVIINELDNRIQTEILYNADQNCKHKIICAPGGGIKCTKCSGWFCY